MVDKQQDLGKVPEDKKREHNKKLILVPIDYEPDLASALIIQRVLNTLKTVPKPIDPQIIASEAEDLWGIETRADELHGPTDE
jgi:hypothetical protein